MFRLGVSILTMCIFSFTIASTAWCGKGSEMQKVNRKYDLVAWGGSQSLRDNIRRIIQEIYGGGKDVTIYRKRRKEIELHLDEVNKMGIDLEKDNIKFHFIQWTEYVTFRDPLGKKVKVPKDHKVKFYVATNFPKNSKIRSHKTGRYLNGREKHPTLVKKKIGGWKLKRIDGDKYQILYHGKALDAGGGPDPYLHESPSVDNRWHLWTLKRKMTDDGIRFMFVTHQTKALDAGLFNGSKRPYFHSNPDLNNKFHLWKISH